MRMLALKPTDAKKRFLSICREVIDDEKRVCILSSTGKPAVVLDYINRANCNELIKITAQNYKDNFSSFSRLSAYGITFQLSLKNRSDFVFVRRFSSYKTTAASIIKEWSEMIAQNAIEREKHNICNVLEHLGMKIDNQNETIESLQSIIKLGMERISIGHHPSREGQIHKWKEDETYQ